MAMILITKLRQSIENWGRGEEVSYKRFTPGFIEAFLSLAQFLVQARAIFICLILCHFFAHFLFRYGRGGILIGNKTLQNFKL